MNFLCSTPITNLMGISFLKSEKGKVFLFKNFKKENDNGKEMDRTFFY